MLFNGSPYHNCPETGIGNFTMSCMRMGTLDQLCPQHCAVIKVDAGVDAIYNGHEYFVGAIRTCDPFRKSFEDEGKQFVP